MRNDHIQADKLMLVVILCCSLFLLSPPVLSQSSVPASIFSIDFYQTTINSRSSTRAEFFPGDSVHVLLRLTNNYTDSRCIKIYYYLSNPADGYFLNPTSDQITYGGDFFINTPVLDSMKTYQEGRFFQFWGWTLDTWPSGSSGTISIKFPIDITKRNPQTQVRNFSLRVIDCDGTPYGGEPAAMPVYILGTSNIVVEKRHFVPETMDHDAPFDQGQFTADTSYAAWNQNLDYEIILRNNGEKSSELLTFTEVLPDGAEFLSASPSGYTISPDHLHITWLALGPLAPGESLTIYIRLRYTDIPNSEPYLRRKINNVTCVDGPRVTAGTDTTLWVGLAPYPDLSPVSLIQLENTPSPGHPLTFSAEIINLGAHCGRFHIQFYAHANAENDVPFDYVTVDTLEFLKTVIVSGTWQSPPMGEYQICVWVDPEQLITEMNEDNNTICILSTVAVTELYVNVMRTGFADTLLDKPGRFCDTILSAIQVYDQNLNPVFGLADTLQWRRQNENNLLGGKVSGVWQELKEYHSSMPQYPADPTIREFEVTEARDDHREPFSFGLVMDLNINMTDLLDDAKRAVIMMIEKLETQDEAAIFSFDGGIRTELYFTPNKDVLRDQVSSLTTASNGAAFYSGLRNAIVNISGRQGAKFIIMYCHENFVPVTEDEHDIIIREAISNNISIYLVSLGDDIHDETKDRMADIADKTNGIYLHVSSSSQMVQIYAKIASLLRSKYYLAYSSPDCALNCEERVFEAKVDFAGLTASDDGKYAAPCSETDIQVTKTSITDSVRIVDGIPQNIVFAGETIHYQIRIINRGIQSADGVTLTDILPENIALIENLNVVPLVSSGSSLQWHFIGIAPGDQYTITFDAVVQENIDQTDAAIVNQAMVVVIPADINSTNNSDADTVYARMSYRAPELFCPVSSGVYSPDDTLVFRALSHAPLASWELAAYWPDGTTEVIANGGITAPNDTLVLYRGNISLHGKSGRESVSFEWHTIDIFNESQTSQTCAAAIKADEYLRLTHNKIEPDVSGEIFEIIIGVRSAYDLKLQILDISGRLVKDFGEIHQEAGERRYRWDLIDEKGSSVGSDVFIVTLEAGTFKSWKKFVVVR
ncbi:MAG: DUF11 domain-containing protein [Calditrichaeota bacterium]|nr:MAG: DUF11 domain-containing protein [Calditrichota bacterium]